MARPKKESAARRQSSIRAVVTEFGVPPIHDALVLGKDSPIGCAAIRKAINLLVASPFEHIEVKDDVVSDVLVRTSILRRCPRDELIAFILEEIKPLMASEEILHLDLETTITVTRER